MIILDDELKVGHLKRISSFVDYLSHDEFLALARIANVREVAAGSVLFHEGDGTDGFYVVKSGRVSFQRGSGEDATELGTLGPGSHFGLLNMLKESPRPSTATVVEPAQLLWISRNEFELLLLHVPDLARKMMTLAFSR